MADGATTRVCVQPVLLNEAAEREAWLAWMVRTGRHYPNCYLDSEQEDMFNVWKAAKAQGPVR